MRCEQVPSTVRTLEEEVSTAGCGVINSADSEPCMSSASVSSIIIFSNMVWYSCIPHSAGAGR